MSNITIRSYDSMTNRDFNSQLAHDTFPHVTQKGVIKATVANLRHLFECYNIQYEYDEILKKQIIIMDGILGTSDNDVSENAMLQHVESLLALNDMPISTSNRISALIAERTKNPILDFIKSKPWDGKDYITDLITTLEVPAENYYYRGLAIKTWLLQCVAAADFARSTPRKDALPKYELVLVLQSKQGLKKTSWFKSLVPKHLRDYIVEGAHLDPANKDSRIEATSCWICELGELDSTFKKADISRLKAFLSCERDRMRLPYDKVTSSPRRHTSFGASVNEFAFFVDSTGNRRYLPLAITECYGLDGIDMQQLWAQVWDLYLKGEQWWCTAELDKLASEQHEIHTETNPITEMLFDNFNMKESQRDPASAIYGDFRHLSVTQILIECGIAIPTKDQIKQAKATLEKAGFVLLSNTRGIRGYWIAKSVANHYGNDNFDDAVAVAVVPNTEEADHFLKVDMPAAQKLGVTVDDYRKLLLLAQSKGLTVGKITTMFKNKFSRNFDALEKSLK